MERNDGPSVIESLQPQCPHDIQPDVFIVNLEA